MSSGPFKRRKIDSLGEWIPLLPPGKLQHGDLTQVWLAGERHSPEPACSLVSLLRLLAREKEAAKEMLQVCWQSFERDSPSHYLPLWISRPTSQHEGACSVDASLLAECVAARKGDWDSTCLIIQVWPPPIALFCLSEIRKHPLER